MPAWGKLYVLLILLGIHLLLTPAAWDNLSPFRLGARPLPTDLITYCQFLNQLGARLDHRHSSLELGLSLVPLIGILTGNAY